eukprot:2248483-Heterocapsa_arctica.AAC.1
MDSCHHGRYRGSRSPPVFCLRLRHWEAGPRETQHGTGPGSLRRHRGPKGGGLDGGRGLEPDA